MTPAQTLDWLADQHFDQCKEERPVQGWIRGMKSQLPAPVQEPESFEQWNAKQHADPEEIGFLQALRIAYCAGQDSVTNATPPGGRQSEDCLTVAQRQWVGLMRGVRVEGETVVISVKCGNKFARQLCAALIEEMNK